ncbi:MAG: hypothetical protein GX055_04615 [Desulfovibrionales bacterium]|nr:hypothetical protein [Desulfovibrionales bacterium]
MSASRPVSRIFFDANDSKLLHIVNDVLSRDSRQLSMSSLLAPYMHPHGIKEMAASQGLRIAYAAASLLGSLKAGTAANRLSALRCLMDEVLLSATSHFKKNTARVLIQIMKELVRHPHDEEMQLRLAHDFRMAVSGRPRIVRQELAKYHLLEMPEEWNQLAFDDRVHDAHTKGRKTPTHLVMDAWIKGLRYLTVVYYNYVRPEVVEELLGAAAILDMHIRIGIEVSCRFQDKYVRITWEPHGFADAKAFQDFLREPAVREFMEEGRQVSAYQQRYVLDVLDAFNARHREVLNKTYGVQLEALRPQDFLRFVGSGQPSLLHLAKYIQGLLRPHLDRVAEQMRAEFSTAGEERRRELQAQINVMNALDSELLIASYLQPARNPDLYDPNIPQDGPEVPANLFSGPGAILERLTNLHSGSRFILNLSNLSIPDIVEILFDCQGRLTHIEIYNLKDAWRGKCSHLLPALAECQGDAVEAVSPEKMFAQVAELQRALNEDNVIALKRIIRGIIWGFEEDRSRIKKNLATARKNDDAEQVRILDPLLSAMDVRKAKLLEILFHIGAFHGFYKHHKLGARLGSASTGQSRRQQGMGVVVLDTLPARARREALLRVSSVLPLTVGTTMHTSVPQTTTNQNERRWCWLRTFFGSRDSQTRLRTTWSMGDISIHPGQPGNIAALGGVQLHQDNGFYLEKPPASATKQRSFRYLNTGLKNYIKIVAGFIPAFLTFWLIQDWWVLAYLGGFIWFGITGVRNIIQAVVGGGGLRRSPLMQWNSLVSWSRISESLLYTGISVPLLDYLIKNLLLDQGLGITISTSPVTLYSVIAITNGLYIYSHNVFRGLPKGAAIVSLFRSILSIPLALGFSAILGSAMQLAALPGVDEMLQKWAAVISKLASDCVAAITAGYVDRQTNIRMRLTDYAAKRALMFDAFARLDVMFPEEDVLDMLQSPKTLIETLNYEARDLDEVFIVNALDLMYFWMYQPRARKALAMMIRDMSQEERLIMYRSQLVLRRYREISQLFVDGLVGKNFSKALAFYLDHSEKYLEDMRELGRKHKAAVL